MQKLAVQSFIHGQDVVVSLQTGSGKSVCYWLLPSVFEHLRGIACCTVIVISPLVALMKDQEHEARGIISIRTIELACKMYATRKYRAILFT